MHLLQLLGGQTWPNFLPLLTFKPSKVSFLTTKQVNRAQTEQTIQAIMHTAQRLGVPAQYEIIETSTKSPTVKECSVALRHHNPDLINITGGTKPMSLAAYLLAQEKETPAFYLDTRRQNNSFEWIGAEQPMQQSLQDVFDSLTVRTALMSQGFPAPSSFNKPSETELNFASEAAALRLQHDANISISKFISDLRQQFLDPNRNGKMYRGAKLRAALQQPIHCADNSHSQKYLQCAASHGLLEAISPVDFLLTTMDPVTENADELRRIAEKNFKLIEGIWFELAVYSKLQNMASFSDVQWSIEAESNNSDSIGETDLVALNKNTLNLHFISCKTSGPHGSSLDHIQGLRHRANKEGGQFCIPELWIFAPRSPSSRASLENHCKEQGVRLRVYSEEV